MPLLKSFKNLSYQEKVLYGAASIIALMLIFPPTVGSDFMRGLRAGFGAGPVAPAQPAAPAPASAPAPAPMTSAGMAAVDPLFPQFARVVQGPTTGAPPVDLTKPVDHSNPNDPRAISAQEMARRTLKTMTPYAMAQFRAQMQPLVSPRDQATKDLIDLENQYYNDQIAAYKANPNSVVDGRGNPVSYDAIVRGHITRSIDMLRPSPIER